MTCLVCKTGFMDNGYVTVTLERDQSIIIIKNVPAEVCDSCGEYILTEEVSRQIMKQAEQAVKNHAEVEILQYAA